MRYPASARFSAFSALFVTLLLLCGSAAQASVITMTQVPSVAPNAYGGLPSWTTYVTNALVALPLGATTVGAPGPGQYNAVTSGWVLPGQVVVSGGFNSWGGVTPPPGGPAYAGELGNRLHFGLVIDGHGQVFRLSGLAFTMTSTPDNFFSFSGGYGTASPFTDYNYYTVGYYYGADGVPGGTGDNADIIYTSGSANNLVHLLIYVGVGNSIWADLESAPPGQPQLNSAMLYVFGMTITNRYCLYDDQGHELVCSDSDVDIVPEPASGLLLLAGLGTLVLGRRFRRR